MKGELAAELARGDGSAIEVRIVKGTAVISANREGAFVPFRPLDNACKEAPGSRIHPDEPNAPEDGSCEPIPERTE